MIEVFTIGGYQNIGRNMTAIKYHDEIVILDMGLDLESYIDLTEDEDAHKIPRKNLIGAGAIPNDSIIGDLKNKVIAIIPTHAHLDHIGAIPFMASKYKNACIYCSPYSAAVLKRICEDDNKILSNPLFEMGVNSKLRLSKNIEIEFINVTHSTPDTVIIVLHTPEGSVVYANDFKFDNKPLLGLPSNTKRLSELDDVKLLIMDSLYAGEDGSTPGELSVKNQLRDLVDNYITKDNVVIATTFSSHVSRLKTLVEFAKEKGRIPVFLGRSLYKYSAAAKDANLIDFSSECDLVKYSYKVKRVLNRMKRSGLSKYFIICTGHQAEPRATLSRIIKEKLIDLDEGDLVIFSSSLIPNERNFLNFDKLIDEIKSTGASVFKEVHVSGHASKDDHKRLIELVNPKQIIPAHADAEKTIIMKEFCESLGDYKVHVMSEGDYLKLD